MMKRNQKKFLLYFKIVNEIDFSIIPDPVNVTIEDQNVLYEFDMDVDQINIVTFHVTNRTENSCLILEKACLNNVEISDINRISYFKTADNKLLKNHGYINQLGQFVIKIHCNAVSQNYLNYLLSLTVTS